MCYSAKIETDYRKLQREYGAAMDFEAFRRLWLREGEPKWPQAPKALEDALLESGPDALRDAVRRSQHHRRRHWEAALATQSLRLADAERKLVSKSTRAAANEARIATMKIAQLQGWLSDLSRRQPLDRDARIYPGSYALVLVSNNGQRSIKPMRFQCRPSGKPATYDRQYPGTYNARRDNLQGFWRAQFGKSHGVLVAHRFYEHVPSPSGENQVLEFFPRDSKPILIACIWSEWRDPAGILPELCSFAAITDEPEPEVAAAGHDRTVVNLKPEHLDAWLAPESYPLDALQSILDDKCRPHYEHRVAL
ncbi:MAG: SOS response-associated peptidase family protein [Lysobacteraceae bacterium]